MDPRTLQLLWMYWTRLRMVAKAGRYFGYPFQGYRGTTLGDPFSPRVFSVVVDSVIQNWVAVVASTEA